MTVRKNAKVKQSEVVAFAYEFAGMYSAGLSLTRCLQILADQSESGTLKTIIGDVRQNIETGTTLKDAFEKYRSVFSDFFLGMIEAGETGGKLGDTLQMAAEYLEGQAELKRKVKSAFAYPIVVGFMCLFIVSALVIFVIPVFQKLYGQLHIQLPMATLILIILSEAVRHYWWAILSGIALIVFASKKLPSNPAVKARLDLIKLKIPIFGQLNRMVLVSRFIRTFTMMASAGVSIVESLELAKQVANNTEMDRVAKSIQESIVTGSSLAAPMGQFALFPPMIVQLAAAGEEAGILPEMLGKGVVFLDKNIDKAVKALLIKMEPILSIIMGAVVGGILLGVYLPMFDYMGQVK